MSTMSRTDLLNNQLAEICLTNERNQQIKQYAFNAYLMLCFDWPF